MSMRRHEISPEAWERIEPLLPGRPGDVGVTAADNRLFINAVYWIAKTGAPWRDLPPRFGRWNSAFQRFNRWAKKGVWQRIAEALSDDADREWVMLDSTVVRAHQHAAGQKGGKKTNAWDAVEEDSAPRSTSRSTDLATPCGSR
jgi:transposase